MSSEIQTSWFETRKNALLTMRDKHLICPDGKIGPLLRDVASRRMSSRLAKNISLVTSGKSIIEPRPFRTDKWGVGRRHERWAGCGGRGVSRDERRLCGRRSRVVLMPRRWHQPVDDADASRRGWWQESPITRESAKEAVKTIAYARLRVSARHLAFPAPSVFGQMIFP
ncbi:MAG: hypothetical protein ABSG88_16280 [Bradyrhizobium sp.]